MALLPLNYFPLNYFPLHPNSIWVSCFQELNLIHSLLYMICVAVTDFGMLISKTSILFLCTRDFDVISSTPTFMIFKSILMVIYYLLRSFLQHYLPNRKLFIDLLFIVIIMCSVFVAPSLTYKTIGGKYSIALMDVIAVSFFKTTL